MAQWTGTNDIVFNNDRNSHSAPERNSRMHGEAGLEGKRCAGDSRLRGSSKNAVRVIIPPKNEIDDTALISLIDTWLARVIAQKIADEMNTEWLRGS